MKYFRLLGIMSLLVFSFYLTDRVTQLAINTNPLMQNIKSNMVNYEVKSVDAIIDNNTIIIIKSIAIITHFLVNIFNVVFNTFTALSVASTGVVTNTLILSSFVIW